MSIFWNFTIQMTPGTLAKAEDVNTNLSGINTGFNQVESAIAQSIQITNAPGVVNVNLNAAARANKLLEFDVNGDIAATTIMGDWKGNHANAAGTDYEIRDVVKDAAGSIGQDNLYICNTTHTSTGSLTVDTANWDLLVEVSAVAASAAAALVSENNAAASFDSFDDRYLGPKASAPTLDNDGNALITGAQYFNSSTDKMNVRTSGAAWALATANAVDVAVADAGGHLTATDVEAALAEIAVLTKFLTVTQAVDLDTMESNIATNNAKISYTDAAAVAANTAKVTNANHSGDATGSGALTITNDAVTLAKMANMATASILGRLTAATGDPEVLSAANVATILNNALTGNIAFPSTQVPDANVNTLDDYEEGTWTPSLGGTATYNNQEGAYTKIGNVVYIQMYLNVNVIGTGNTKIISGLPFSTRASPPTLQLLQANVSGASATGIVDVNGVLSPSITNIELRSRTAAAVGDGSNAIFQNSTICSIAGFYLI